MREKVLLLTVLVAAAAMMAAFSSPAWARVQGPCSECHTMHSSQSPPPQDWLDNNWTAGQEPNVALLAYGAGTNVCLGCHQAAGADQNNGSNNIPYVHQSQDPAYGLTGTTGNTLAGGTFYYLELGPGTSQEKDAKGHNVLGIAGMDSGLMSYDPPGYDNFVTGRPATWSAGTQLRCAGSYGCHGYPNVVDQFAAISGGHHGDDSVINGSSIPTSYRFLMGIVGNEWNTSGATGGRWEYKPTSTAHNQYKGADRTDDIYSQSSTSTISYLCAECHGFFHSSDNASGIDEGGIDDGAWGNWVRHPTDYDMGNTVAGSEYRSYGPTYNVDAPVASTVASSVVDTVTFNNDTIVTCISCHRAHGSDYADLLRWQYNMDAGSGTDNGGCFICHTTKDDA